MTGTRADAPSRSSGDGGYRTTAPLSLIGLFTSFGAVFTGWCCVLPSTLAALGAGGAGLGSLSQLTPYQPYFLALAPLSVTAGWISGMRKQGAARCEDGAECARPAPRRWTLAMLMLSTLLLALAILSAWMPSATMASM